MSMILKDKIERLRRLYRRIAGFPALYVNVPKLRLNRFGEQRKSRRGNPTGLFL
jgi:hypothetical protein